MKKIIYAIIGASLLLLAGCEEKGEVFYQNPYRIIVDYTPSTFTIDGVSGTVTPDGDYNWITSNGNGSFTVRRNTSGLIRRAEFTIAGSNDKAVVSQRAHSLDAALATSVADINDESGSVDVTMKLSTEFPDDYTSWGVLYSTENNRETAKKIDVSEVPSADGNVATVAGIDTKAVNYFWTYVVSTEGDITYGPSCGINLVYYVTADDDLQTALDNAPEFAELRVEGGALFYGPIVFNDKNKNKSISGGWNSDFTEQSWDNLTIIDGDGKNRGIYCGEDPVTDMPLQGYVEISYFEIKNGYCASGHGAGLRISGGPVTVHHCWFHHNEADRGGAISTREDDQSSDLTVYNCVITNNVSNGHAAAISIEDGKARKEPTHATIVGNIIANNRSIKHDGYAAAVYFYQSVDVKFINNTVINSLNFYEDNGNWWGNFYCRYNTCAIIANNMILRSWCSKKDNVAFIEERPIEGGGASTTFNNNIVTGKLWNVNGPQQGNLLYDHNYDAKSFLNNPDVDMVANAELQDKDALFKYNKLTDFIGDNYLPKGDAVGAGTVGTFPYKSYESLEYSADITAILEKIGTDINGNPFIKGGKVDIGALQSK